MGSNPFCEQVQKQTSLPLISTPTSPLGRVLTHFHPAVGGFKTEARGA